MANLQEIIGTVVEVRVKDPDKAKGLNGKAAKIIRENAEHIESSVEAAVGYGDRRRKVQADFLANMIRFTKATVGTVKADYTGENADKLTSLNTFKQCVSTYQEILIQGLCNHHGIERPEEDKAVPDWRGLNQPIFSRCQTILTFGGTGPASILKLAGLTADLDPREDGPEGNFEAAYDRAKEAKNGPKEPEVEKEPEPDPMATGTGEEIAAAWLAGLASTHEKYDASLIREVVKALNKAARILEKEVEIEAK